MFDQVKLIIAAICLVLIGITGYFMFSYVKSLGYNEANAACVARFDEYKSQIDAKLDQVQTSVSDAAGTLVTSNQLLQDDLRKLGFRVSKLPTTIIKDGKCVPNPDALVEVKEAIRRVNAELGKK